MTTGSPARSARCLIALGDSVTAGIGDVRDRGGWAEHLAALLQLDVVNLGRNGARARDLVATQLAAVRGRTVVPALVSVFAGGNDVLRGDFDAEEVRANLATVVDTALSAGATVILVIPPRVGAVLPGPAVVRSVLARRMDQVRAGVVAVATRCRDSESRLVLVDAQAVLRLGGQRALHVDRIHPSPYGHRLLATVVAGRLVDEGWDAGWTMTAAPEPPSSARSAWWLLSRGLPWLVRRSRDLLPELLLTVAREYRQERRREVC